MFKTVLSILSICVLTGFLTISSAWTKPVEEIVSITVKSDAVISKREVTLADIGLISTNDEALLKALSSLTVMRTPRVGYAEQVSRQGLEQLIKAQFPSEKLSIVWSGARFVKVYSAAQTISAQKLTDIAIGTIRKQLSGRFDLVDLQVVSLTRELSVPPGEISFHVRPIDVRQIYARMPIWIDILIDGVLYRSTVVSLSLRTERTVLVAKRNMQEGTTVSADDFETRREDVAGMNDGLAVKDSFALSPRLKKPIVEGQILTQKHLQPRGAVLRGDWVKLIYADQAIVLETRAMAEQEGQIGELIKVRLDKGSENIAGRIVSSGVVEIQGR